MIRICIAYSYYLSIHEHNISLHLHNCTESQKHISWAIELNCDKGRQYSNHIFFYNYNQLSISYIFAIDCGFFSGFKLRIYINVTILVDDITITVSRDYGTTCAGFYTLVCLTKKN